MRQYDRQYDPRPVRRIFFEGRFIEGENLAEYIDRTICGKPVHRLWMVWGWPRPLLYFEASWVNNPYVPSKTPAIDCHGGGSRIEP